MRKINFENVLCFVGMSVLTVLGFGVCTSVLIGVIKLFEAAFLK